MIGFLLGWWRAKAARPLLWWTLALAAYVALPVPQHLVLFLIVGLGVALTVTVGRLRAGGRRAVDSAERAWSIADQIGTAVADRIRHTATAAQLDHHDTAGVARPQLAPTPAMYDPGALLSAVAAVLHAEGLPVDAAYGMAGCVDLLRWINVTAVAGVPAPTARGLAAGLAPAEWTRPHRAAPPVLLAGCVAAVLVGDGALSAQPSPEMATALVEGCAAILDDLGIVPDPRAGTLADWPVMGEILAAAPHHHGRGL
ncbi:MAG: hypothetical protein ACRDSR_07235 [Pseudonocardiaceae bacterium]